MCESCLNELVNSSAEGQISCPECRAEVHVPDGDVRQLQINYTVQSIWDDFRRVIPQDVEAETGAANIQDHGNGWYFDFSIIKIETGEEEALSILDFLELLQVNGRRLRGYYHPRDARPGTYKITNITNSIENSRYVLIIISPGAKDSQWWEYKENVALVNRLNNPSRKDTLIPICTNTMTTTDLPINLDSIEILVYDPDRYSIFWQKLRLLFQEQNTPSLPDPELGSNIPQSQSISNDRTLAPSYIS